MIVVPAEHRFDNDFFEVFGIRRASVAAFEANVRNLQGHVNAIDLFWRGKLIAEHKSRGQSLEQAETQAFGYIENITRSGRFDELPRFVLVSDFANFVLYDLEPEEQRNGGLGLPASENVCVTCTLNFNNGNPPVQYSCEGLFTMFKPKVTWQSSDSGSIAVDSNSEQGFGLHFGGNERVYLHEFRGVPGRAVHGERAVWIGHAHADVCEPGAAGVDAGAAFRKLVGEFWV